MPALDLASGPIHEVGESVLVHRTRGAHRRRTLPSAAVRILVTGGTGFVGSYATVALTEAGHDVRLLARDPGKVSRVFEPHRVGPAEVVEGDITDAASVDAALAGCDGVLHAAAVVAVSRRRAAEVLATNATGTRNVVGRRRAGWPDPHRAHLVGQRPVLGGPPPGHP